MSDEIKNTSSASIAVENAENVIKAEFSNLKRKLEETEAELENEKKKSKQLDTLKAKVSEGVKLRPKRARICLSLTKCADLLGKKEFAVYSDPTHMAGFSWKLKAEKLADSPWLGLFLHLYPPEHHKGQYEFDVSISFRLFKVFPEKDIHKQCTKKFKRNDPPNGWGFGKFVEIKKLLDSTCEFLQDDGSIQAEVHFTAVEIAALGHLLPTDEKENGSKKGGN